MDRQGNVGEGMCRAVERCIVLLLLVLLVLICLMLLRLNVRVVLRLRLIRRLAGLLVTIMMGL